MDAEKQVETEDGLTETWLREHGFVRRADRSFWRGLGGARVIAEDCGSEGWMLSVVDSFSDDWRRDKVVLSMEPTKEDVLALVVMADRHHQDKAEVPHGN